MGKESGSRTQMQVQDQGPWQENRGMMRNRRLRWSQPFAGNGWRVHSHIKRTSLVKAKWGCKRRTWRSAKRTVLHTSSGNNLVKVTLQPIRH